MLRHCYVGVDAGLPGRVAGTGEHRRPQTCLFGDFVEQVYLPFYERKWKRSTTLTNKDRVNHHLVPEFGIETLGSFNREKLQAFLDRKDACGLSFSVVDHLRWHLKQVFGIAVAEGFIARNPAALLFTPKECP